MSGFKTIINQPTHLKRMAERKIKSALISVFHKDGLENIVKSEKDDEGNKYIKIRTDIGYDRFKKD